MPADADTARDPIDRPRGGIHQLRTCDITVDCVDKRLTAADSPPRP